MTIPALYEIETREVDDGTMQPVEHVWRPGKDTERLGFLAYRGLHIAGIGGPGDEEDAYPAAFIALGHQQWSDVIKAAAAYMARVHGWRNLHLYPGDDPAVRIPRIPRAIHTHAVILHHPHPDHPCGCEWDDTWRTVWAPPTEPGAVLITAMRHPAAPATASSIPTPDHNAVSATWAA